jgi:hypothetical protein
MDGYIPIYDVAMIIDWSSGCIAHSDCNDSRGLEIYNETANLRVLAP